ncbi:hypothetical protein PR001_g8192 [Phytophthora rubi]|uniref:Uncharacterized protein n=1 Tax=Phytophthora rubi TaxID=129364 RepID=A0A6A3N1A8_9STRA|nr:hypothetical protein PR001_g8192 [Phytophthora rubi]
MFVIAMMTRYWVRLLQPTGDRAVRRTRFYHLFAALSVLGAVLDVLVSESARGNYWVALNTMRDVKSAALLSSARLRSPSHSTSSSVTSETNRGDTTAPPPLESQVHSRQVLQAQRARPGLLLRRVRDEKHRDHSRRPPETKGARVPPLHLRARAEQRVQCVGRAIGQGKSDGNGSHAVLHPQLVKVTYANHDRTRCVLDHDETNF